MLDKFVAHTILFCWEICLPNRGSYKMWNDSIKSMSLIDSNKYSSPLRRKFVSLKFLRGDSVIGPICLRIYFLEKHTFLNINHGPLSAYKILLWSLKIDLWLWKTRVHNLSHKNLQFGLFQTKRLILRYNTHTYIDFIR